MNARVFAIDVDLTVVNTLTPWLFWFKGKTGKEVLNEERTYDLVPEMQKLIAESGVEPFDPMDFWKHPKLYDFLLPAPGSVEFVEKVIQNGDIVVFVSTCVTEHTDSKIRFLKKHFHKDCKFISTFHKELVDYYALIDDRLHHMRIGQDMRPEANHILYTGYRSDGYRHERERFTNFGSWKEILNFFFPPY